MEASSTVSASCLASFAGDEKANYLYASFWSRFLIGWELVSASSSAESMLALGFSCKPCRESPTYGVNLLRACALARFLLTDTKPFIGLLAAIVVFYPELLFYFGKVAVECVLFVEPES